MTFRTSPSPARAEMNDPSDQAEFLCLLSRFYNDIYAAALVIVGNRSDTDDVIQETSLVLWQKYGESKPILNFRKWARTVAFHVAKNHLRKQQRRTARLSDYVLSRIEQVQTGGEELFELRRELLDNCIEKLGERDRQFLEVCYGGSHSLAELARSRKAPIETFYTRLKRLRKRLADCINRTFASDL